MASSSRGGRQAIHFVDDCACACCAAVQKLFLLLFYEGSTEQLRARAVPVLQQAYTQLLEGAYLDRLQTTDLGTPGGSQEGPPLLDKREHQLLVTQVERDPEVQLFHHPGQLQDGLVNVIEEKVQHLQLVRLRALALTKQREKVQALLERHVHHLLESGE